MLWKTFLSSDVREIQPKAAIVQMRPHLQMQFNNEHLGQLVKETRSWRAGRALVIALVLQVL
jgi:hypothetical protein